MTEIKPKVIGGIQGSYEGQSPFKQTGSASDNHGALTPDYHTLNLPEVFVGGQLDFELTDAFHIYLLGLITAGYSNTNQNSKSDDPVAGNQGYHGLTLGGEADLLLRYKNLPYGFGRLSLGPKVEGRFQRLWVKHSGLDLTVPTTTDENGTKQPVDSDGDVPGCNGCTTDPNDPSQVQGDPTAGVHVEGLPGATRPTSVHSVGVGLQAAYDIAGDDREYPANIRLGWARTSTTVDYQSSGNKTEPSATSTGNKITLGFAVPIGENRLIPGAPGAIASCPAITDDTTTAGTPYKNTIIALVPAGGVKVKDSYATLLRAMGFTDAEIKTVQVEFASIPVHSLDPASKDDLSREVVITIQKGTTRQILWDQEQYNKSGILSPVTLATLDKWVAENNPLLAVQAAVEKVQAEYKPDSFQFVVGKPSQADLKAIKKAIKKIQNDAALDTLAKKQVEYKKVFALYLTPGTVDAAEATIQTLAKNLKEVMATLHKAYPKATIPFYLHASASPEGLTAAKNKALSGFRAEMLGIALELYEVKPDGAIGTGADPAYLIEDLARKLGPPPEPDADYFKRIRAVRIVFASPTTKPADLIANLKSGRTLTVLEDGKPLPAPAPIDFKARVYLGSVGGVSKAFSPVEGNVCDEVTATLTVTNADGTPAGVTLPAVTANGSYDYMLPSAPVELARTTLTIPQSREEFDTQFKATEDRYAAAQGQLNVLRNSTGPTAMSPETLIISLRTSPAGVTPAAVTAKLAEFVTLQTELKDILRYTNNNLYLTAGAAKANLFDDTWTWASIGTTDHDNRTTYLIKCDMLMSHAGYTKQTVEEYITALNAKLAELNTPAAAQVTGASVAAGYIAATGTGKAVMTVTGSVTGIRVNDETGAAKPLTVADLPDGSHSVSIDVSGLAKNKEYNYSVLVAGAPLGKLTAKTDPSNAVTLTWTAAVTPPVQVTEAQISSYNRANGNGRVAMLMTGNTAGIKVFNGTPPVERNLQTATTPNGSKIVYFDLRGLAASNAYLFQVTDTSGPLGDLTVTTLADNYAYLIWTPFVPPFTATVNVSAYNARAKIAVVEIPYTGLPIPKEEIVIKQWAGAPPKLVAIKAGDIVFAAKKMTVTVKGVKAGDPVELPIYRKPVAAATPGAPAAAAAPVETLLGTARFTGAVAAGTFALPTPAAPVPPAPTPPAPTPPAPTPPAPTPPAPTPPAPTPPAPTPPGGDINGDN